MLTKPEHCRGCLGYTWGCGGYVPASGSGSNGVLIVAEAAGENEASAGVPLVGKAGEYFWTNLSRVGLNREDFKVHNVLSCRPPNNELRGASYEKQVIAYCSPLLDSTIAEMQKSCKLNGKTFVILTLGKIAFKRIMGIDETSSIMREDYLNYPFWNQKYEAWVIAADHPSFMMRGSHHLIPVMQFAAKRAVEIAKEGLVLDTHQYLLDPPAHTFQQWIQDYFKVLDHDPLNTYLSYDIETPMKQGSDEEDVSKEEDLDYTILRCSFAYRPNEAVSVMWGAEYLPLLEELFASDGQKIGWNLSYDSPRVRAQIPINGVELDAMLAWHVLNTSMRKGLGYVTPFYAKNTLMWKHLSNVEPAFYNAKDADMALRNWLGILKNLKDNDLSKVFHKHVVEVSKVFSYMSKEGVYLNQDLRKAAEERVGGELKEVEERMVSIVPMEARIIDKVFKNDPKEEDRTGLYSRPGSREQNFCSHCGIARPRKDHFKRYVKKVNPCADASAVVRSIEVVEWYRLRDWKLSVQQLTSYQKVYGHKPVIDRKRKAVTFDENAILKLVKNYPNDPLYPVILDFRKRQKLLSTYIGVTDQETGRINGGMPVGRDGRVHTLFTMNPSTLRSASQQPNLQNLPRPNPKDKGALENLIRGLITAGDGCVFTATDFSGIEAVLVGYFALAPQYIRLALRDVHSYYTAYALHALDGRISGNDLPLLSWDDHKLFKRLGEIKKEFGQERNSLYKHLVHAINFGQGAKGAQEKILNETGVTFPINLISKVMGTYKELFPEIPKWHTSVLLQAEKDGFLRNPFGYVHRFNRVFDYEWIGGKCQKSQGPQANQAWAFLPQSTAAGIIKEAMLRLFFERFDEAGQYLRLLVHDELFAECPVDIVAEVRRVMEEEMSQPIPELRLPSSYGMGPYLAINVESKEGKRWGEMH